MDINVRCPQCDTRYRLRPEMRGQRTRCQNSVCRAVFEVQEEPETPPEPSNGPVASGGARPAPFELAPVKHQAGNVGDIVPILPVEAAHPPVSTPHEKPLAASEETSIPFVASHPVSGAPASDAPTWRQPPPVRRAPTTGGDPPSAPVRQEPLPEPQPAPKKAEPPRKAPGSDSTKLARKPSAATARPAPTVPAPAAAAPPPSVPVEVPAGNWEPPPVRRGAGAAEAGESTTAEQPAVASAVDELMPPPRKPSRALKWGIGVAAAACVAAISAVLWFVFVLGPKSEGGMYAHAQQLFADSKYFDAYEVYDKLAKDYPDSEKPTYEFLAALSQQLNEANSLSSDREKTFDTLKSLCEAKAHEALLQERKSHVEKAFLLISEDLIEKAATKSDTKLLDKGGDAATLAGRYNTSKQNKEKTAAFHAKIAETKGQIAHAHRIRESLEKLAALVNDPDELEKAWEKVRGQLPELRAGHPEVKKIRDQAQEQYRKRVVWKPRPEKATVAQIAEEKVPAMFIAPNILRAAAFVDDGKVVFGLTRGVLTAHAQSNGDQLWWIRVGIDTTALPVRLPPTEISRERVLVLSSDTNTLTARDVRTGQAAWRHQLGDSPCLGRPVIARDRLAFVSTYDGKVHVIEVVNGQLLGWYELGKALTVGGALQQVRMGQEDKKFLYVPADEGYVFVLDIADSARKQPCVAVIPSGHPSGSLRTEPIVVTREESRLMAQKIPEEWPDFLMLCQADGLNSMKVRLFHIPVQSSASLSAESGSAVPGWSWFPPHLDGEKFVQVTDVGALDLRGIQQLGNADPAIFSELKPVERRAGSTAPPGRAQIVHVAEDDLWVLARGELTLQHFDKFGQRVVNVWQNPLPLGSPLHASYVNEASKTAFVVTQDLAKPACRISAVDTSSDAGKLHWQRQLGLVCQGDPLLFDNTVLAQDESGSLFLFDPAKYPPGSERDWPANPKVLAEPAGSTALAQFLVASRDGKSVLAVASGLNNKLFIRRFEAGQIASASEAQLSDVLAGIPGVGEKSVVVATKDGKLWHGVFGTNRLTPGPAWRYQYAEKTAPGHVIHLEGDQFLATNGHKGLARWLWDGGGEWTKQSAWRWPERGQKQQPVPESAGSITAPPLLLSGAADPDLQVIVIDSRGQATLLREAPAGNERTWTEVRSWSVGGKVTAGPFRRGNDVGFVMDNERLVFIDPAQEGIRWSYSRPGEGIVGQPRLVGGAIVVAHRTGHFVALEPSTGKPLAEGYKPKVQAAPAAAPVAFGNNRAFAPLTDGTVLLLSLKDLGAPQVAAGQPPATP